MTRQRYLYHGTDASNLQSILADGLRPRRSTSGNWKGVSKSISSLVYLTDTMAGYFACYGKDETAGLVLEIDIEKLKPQNFYPDEDMLRMGKYDGKTEILSVFDSRPRSRLKILDSIKHQWPDSLSRYGLCAHRGAIPIFAISRYAVFQKSIEYLCLFDNSVSPWHWILKGKLLRNNRFLFSGKFGEGGSVFDREYETKMESRWAEITKVVTLCVGRPI